MRNIFEIDNISSQDTGTTSCYQTDIILFLRSGDFVFNFLIYLPRLFLAFLLLILTNVVWAMFNKK